jgi:DNA-binding MarR family transcriptional regulator
MEAKNYLEALKNAPHYEVSKDLVKKLGLKEALVLAYFLNETWHLKHDEGVHKTHIQIAEDLSIGKLTVKRIIKKLSDTGFIEITLKGYPGKHYYNVLKTR